MNSDSAMYAGHPNRAPFKGILGYVDKPSDTSPSGARGRRVILLREAAQAALPSLIGMGVNFSLGWDKHDARNKAGILTRAEIEEHRICVEGYMFCLDFPDVMRRLRKTPEPMGMSYELHNAHVVDMRAAIWKIDRVTFIGAAISLRSKCAYRNTSFELDNKIVPAMAALSAIRIEADHGD